MPRQTPPAIKRARQILVFLIAAGPEIENQINGELKYDKNRLFKGALIGQFLNAFIYKDYIRGEESSTEQGFLRLYLEKYKYAYTNAFRMLERVIMANEITLEQWPAGTKFGFMYNRFHATASPPLGYDNIVRTMHFEATQQDLERLIYFFGIDTAFMPVNQLGVMYGKKHHVV